MNMNVGMPEAVESRMKPQPGGGLCKALHMLTHYLFFSMAVSSQCLFQHSILFSTPQCFTLLYSTLQ